LFLDLLGHGFSAAQMRSFRARFSGRSPLFPRHCTEENPTMRTTAERKYRTVTRSILGVNVTVSSHDKVLQQSLRWAKERRSRTLVFANVHVVMEAFDNPAFLERLNRADMVNPDGMPLAWALHALGEGNAQQVRGSDAMAAMLGAAEKAGISVGFYGGTPDVLDSLVSRVRLLHTHLDIGFFESPPFRVLAPDEDLAVVVRIASSRVRWLFVGLGCPKQENWIMEHVGRIPAVMFGVGAAFDYLAGSKPEAPRWMMSCGLEWVFRLASEPRRLAKRYFKHNPRFILLFLRQLLAGFVCEELAAWHTGTVRRVSAECLAFSWGRHDSLRQIRQK
jgi:N-acetylglucosaminyldiphosphoundecaprenol N-acetyl-beta-D-mannosaminyltransferase